MSFACNFFKCRPACAARPEYLHTSKYILMAHNLCSQYFTFDELATWLRGFWRVPVCARECSSQTIFPISVNRCECLACCYLSYSFAAGNRAGITLNSHSAPAISFVTVKVAEIQYIAVTNAKILLSTENSVVLVVHLQLLWAAQYRAWYDFVFVRRLK